MTRVTGLLVLMAALLVSPAWAADKGLFKSGHPERYVVKDGDTLWDIASQFLHQPWRWAEVWRANPKDKHPHKIFAGDTIRVLVGQNQKFLGVKRGRPTIKLSPKARSTPLASEIPSIPIHSIAPFLTKTRVVGPYTLPQAPYVVAIDGEHVMGGGGDRIHVRAIEDTHIKAFNVVRPGKTYVDPDSGETLGYEAVHVADAKLLQGGDPALLVITSSRNGVVAGDKVIEESDRKWNQYFLPALPDYPVEARIMAVLNGVSQVGQHQVVALNKGVIDGLKDGNVLAVYQEGRMVRDVGSEKGEGFQLPDRKAGLLMVFRTYERMSYALVLHATEVMHVGDRVALP